VANTEGIRPFGQRSCLIYIKVEASPDVRGRSSSDMFGKIVLVLSVLAWASAQIPNFGFCPEYVPMTNFNMQRVSKLISLDANRTLPLVLLSPVELVVHIARVRDAWTTHSEIL